MKYTRNRQMGKSMKWKAWKGQKNLKMSEMTKRTKELDPTFKWHRECYPWGYNWIEFGSRDSHTLVKSK
ncbi:hypothetical protein ACQKF0_29970 [Bacillus wiedmannii]|uniref:hypothetical protein n=1 Tax=Bacillus wiedmannii TaxID=1890302 RepID=UPI003D0956F9